MIVFVNLYPQTKILSGYNFNDGEYVLYSRSGSNCCKEKNIVDSLGDWYINNNQIIQQVNNVWQLRQKKEFDFYDNGYDFDISLYKNKLKVETFYVNQSTWTLYHRNKAYYFGPEHLRIIFRKTKSRINHQYRRYEPYDSLGVFHPSEFDSANAYYHWCLKDTSVMIITRTNADQGAFEGCFFIEYPITASNKKFGPEKTVDRLYKELKNKYGTSHFKVEFEDMDTDKIYFLIWCNKDFFDWFTSYTKIDYYEENELWSKSFFSIGTLPTNQKSRYTQAEIDAILEKFK